jgi:hypothetical protein
VLPTASPDAFIFSVPPGPPPLSEHPIWLPLQPVYNERTPSNPDEGVNVIVLVEAVATKLYHTSFSEEELDTSHDAFASPLVVAFAIVPDVVTHVVLGVSEIAAEQLSFAGGVGGGGGGELFIRL